MNKFDERYDIRLARYDEIDEIMSFIDTHWRKGHILAVNRPFFEYEMTEGEDVHFVIAKDRETGEIHGIHGYLKASSETEPDMWGCIWKVIPGSMGMLGLEIVKRLEGLAKCRSFLTMGANPETLPLLKIARRFEDVGKMSHFYCLSDRREYHIARVGHYEPFHGIDTGYTVRRIDNIEELKKDYEFRNEFNVYPYKDAWYYDHRFFSHPIYEYQIYGIYGDDLKAFFVCREQEYDGQKALRIVDYNGDPKAFEGISSFLKEKRNEYEYIDMYCYGFDTEGVLKAGMIELKEDDTNIIPNYFAPYAAANIDIWVGTPKGRALFFKADGDQDRPS